MSFKIQDTTAVYIPAEPVDPPQSQPNSKKNEKKNEKNPPISKKVGARKGFSVKYDPTNQPDYF